MNAVSRQTPARTAGRQAVATLVKSATFAAGMGAAMLAGATEVEDFVSQSLRDVSLNPVQSALGTVIGQICPSGTIINNDDLQARCNEIAVGAVVEGNDISGARDAMQAMAAEEDAVIASTQVDASSGQIDAIGQRISNVRGGATTGVVQHQGRGFDWSGGAAGDAASNPWGFFVSGVYASTDRDSTAREAGFDADDYGVTAGLDYTFDGKVLVGAAFGYNDSEADVNNNGGKIDSESYSFFGYWSLYPDDYWYIDGMVGYTDTDHDQTRNIIYNIAALGGGTTSVNNAAISDTDSEEWSISITAGRNIYMGNWVVTPMARFDYADTEIDAFTESMQNAAAGGSGLALSIDGQDFESMMLAAGGTLATSWATSFGTVFPELSIEYVHEFKNSNAPITGRFVNDTSQTTIVLLTDSPDRNFFNFGAGMSASFNDTTSGYFRYQGLFGYRDLDVHAFEVGIRATF